ncbi:hypothetical protein [Methylobacterium nodulans]|uniref:hypothetical protein n=1 Tax=Methylobacterium nodulans TaxID=114616 RepID=UPI0005C213FD|nr:hypothetical protein [Methylobacterium nodulans]
MDALLAAGLRPSLWQGGYGGQWTAAAPAEPGALRRVGGAPRRLAIPAPRRYTGPDQATCLEETRAVAHAGSPLLPTKTALRAARSRALLLPGLLLTRP